MAYPWTYLGQTIVILPGGVKDEQAVSITVRQVPYSGPQGAYILDSGGIGPETITLTLWFPNASAFTTFRNGASGIGTDGPLNWMFGTTPDVLLKSLNLKTFTKTADLPVEADAQFLVITPIPGSGGTSYDAAQPWRFTPTGGAPATLLIPDQGFTDDYAAEATNRQLPGAQSVGGPSWYTDNAGPGMETIHLSLTWASAAAFLGFRQALLGTSGTLTYPLGTVTTAVLTKLSVTQIFLQAGYPVMAEADFLVVQP